MANSAPPVQAYMLTLAIARLTPEKFALLQYKLASGSSTAMKIMDAIKPGEWEGAVGDTREFNDIKCRLEDAIDAWKDSNPKSKSFVWPLKAPVQEATITPGTNTANDTDALFAQLKEHIAAATGPKPVVRKKPSIVFVTDRRQSKPSPAVVDQMQQTGNDTGMSTKGVDAVEDINQVADRGKIRRKSYLVKHYPGLAKYFSEASRNGLTGAASTGKKGFWYEGDFKKWAITRDYLTEPTSNKKAPLGKSNTTLANAWRTPVSRKSKH